VSTLSGLLCPVCGLVAHSRQERSEPVVNADTGRQLGWTRLIATYTHDDGTEHRVPLGPIFKPPVLR
jgi:hypothetical protein